jgi:Domain of unknown function (DUF4388)
LADDAFPISGSIDPKAFPFLLMDLHRQAATGSLKVDGPTYQKALYFRGGRILFGSSNDPKDQLGAILIESGRISPEQLEDVNAKVGPGSPLAKVLAESGFVSQRELSEAARAKVERILSDVLSYDSGSFDFEDGVLPKGAVDLKLATDKLVLSATRRISERPFALRHVGGLEAVLALMPGAQERLAEVPTESGRLGDFLDGRRSLKDAAAAARLDEFDAAKIACGFLFLGLATLGGATPPATGPEASGFAIVEGDELDLGTTARMAFAGPAPSPTVIVEPEPALDPSAFAPPTPEAPLPAAPAAERPRRSLEPETMYIEPPAEAATITPHAATRPLPLTPPPRPSASDTKPPVVARAPQAQPPGGFEPLAAPEPPPKSRPPSREDLAALDALLNSSSLEGPLTPLEKEPEARWDSRSPASTGRPQARRGKSGAGRALPTLLALGVLGGGGAAGWYWYQSTSQPPARPRVEPRSAQIPVTTTTVPAAEVPTTMADAPSSLQTPSPGPASTTAPPSTAATAAPPTTPPASAGQRPTTGVAGVSLAEARRALETGDFTRAARGFEAQVRNAGSGAYSVQLLVACSEETVAKAARNVTDKELFILPAEYKGRSCYRVCWGVYESESEARAAVASVPEYFRKGGASPKPVATAAILP